MAKQRVVIIGAGVLGLFTATHLLEDDRYQVVVLDGQSPGDGSSGRSVGMVETQYFTRPEVQVRAYGREIFSDLETNHGVTFTHGGYLRLARNVEDLEMFTQSIGIQQEFGITDAEIISAEELAKRWPQIVSEDLSGALLGAWDGFVDGFEVCQVLAKIVRGKGGDVKIHTPATAATYADGVWNISTPNGDIEAEIVVNAAGPHAGKVGDMLGAPVPLLPQLHGAITVKLPKPQASTPFVMDYIPGSGVDGVYFRSEGERHLIAGLHTEEAIGESVDPDVTLVSVGDETLERIITLLAERLEDADELELDRSWQGIYPMTPDHAPMVGEHASGRGVFCAIGGGGSGIQLGPAIGRLTSDAIRGEGLVAFELGVKWNVQRLS